MSLKNSVGMVPRKKHTLMRELHGSPDQRRMIAEINAAYRPALIVLDGLQAFVDEGPMKGPRKDAGVFLAGTDRLAIDAVGVAILKDLGSNDAIMKPRVFDQEQIAWAVQLELGVSSAADIVIETPDPASEAYAKKIRKYPGRLTGSGAKRATYERPRSPHRRHRVRRRPSARAGWSNAAGRCAAWRGGRNS